MRLGAALDFHSDDPEEIARGYALAGYSAAVCPPVSLAQPERMKAIQAAFTRWDVLLAEIGAWNNMLDPDPQRQAANIEANIQALAVAEELGILCCVNIAGSYHPHRWDGPHPRNLSAEAFAQTVENVRKIIDAVKPRRARYTLETMPWTLPDSPDVYLKLIRAIDRAAFGVHLDPVNLINCPSRFYDNAALLRECFEKLGAWIVSCHAKDVVFEERLTVHLQEVPPGQGELDYSTFLFELSRLPGETPLIIEHLPMEQYPAARNYLLAVAARYGLAFYQPQGLADA